MQEVVIITELDIHSVGVILKARERYQARQMQRQSTHYEQSQLLLWQVILYYLRINLFSTDKLLTYHFIDAVDNKWFVFSIGYSEPSFVAHKYLMVISPFLTNLSTEVVYQVQPLNPFRFC